MKTYKLHVIRHGMTDGNKEGYYVGSKNLPVCEEGKAELQSILNEFEYPYIEKLYTSPLQRCIDTANIIYPDMEQNVINEMRECCFGEFEGRKFTELQNDENYLRWLGDSLNNPPPGGESADAFLDRLLKGLGRIFRDMMDNNITSAALITHGGVIMNLFSAIGLPKHSVTEWKTMNGSGYTVILTPQMWMRDNSIEIYDVIPKEKRDD